MVEAPGREYGRLRLRAELVGGRTAITALARSTPFVVCPPSHRDPDGRAELIVQQTGPGALPGDRLAVEIEIGPGARLLVRGQSATRVFPCPPGAWIGLHTRIRVAAGGELIVLPGELIPYREAELRSSTTIEVAPGGRCAVAEIVTGGRLAMGERDAYRRLELRTSANLAGTPVLIERAELEPALRPLSAPGRHGPFPVAASLVVLGATGEPPPPVRGPDLIAAAGRRGEVTIVRAVGMRTELCRATMERAVAALFAAR